MLKVPTPVVGGWMESGARALLASEGTLRLAVVGFYENDVVKCVEGQQIRYYLVPKSPRQFEKFFKEITTDFKPDIVHIHGTEYPHSLAYVNACGTKNTIVSIQGMVSVYTNYYFGGLGLKDRRPSIRDFLRGDYLYSQKKQMAVRGESEKNLLGKISHVIGRTSWDFSHVWAINPKANYHFCNETLRSAFYNKKWHYDGCRPYSIFLSQAHYPIKGVQQVIKIIPLIKRHFPLVKVYVAGHNFMNVSPLRRSGFANFVTRLMKQYGVTKDIIFLGSLDEEKMAEQYQKAHVFVCPSSIENSANSVGEAQLVGVPCIASYVGGSMDMISDGETGFLYRFEESVQLAYRICQLFSDPNLCKRISTREREVANERHNPSKNAERLLEIYKSLHSYD